jgi:1-acyl-sn-glycerol-3-phosphate acyltransferase
MTTKTKKSSLLREMLSIIQKIQSFFAVAISLTLCGTHATAIIFVSLIKRPQWSDIFIRHWARTILKLARIRLEVSGLENVPDEGVVFLFNHQSLLDIPIVHTAIPHKTFRFGSKKELFKLPIFGTGMRIAGIIPIDRQNRDKAIGALNEAGKRLRAGESFVLAPEGTRQKKPILGPFKTGPFALAINNDAKLVPVVINGAHDVLPAKTAFFRYRKNQSVVKVRILEPIPTKDYTFDTRNELKDLTRAKMLTAYES